MRSDGHSVIPGQTSSALSLVTIQYRTEPGCATYLAQTSSEKILVKGNRAEQVENDSRSHLGCIPLHCPDDKHILVSLPSFSS